MWEGHSTPKDPGKLGSKSTAGKGACGRDPDQPGGLGLKTQRGSQEMMSQQMLMLHRCLENLTAYKKALRESFFSNYPIAKVGPGLETPVHSTRQPKATAAQRSSSH